MNFERFFTLFPLFVDAVLQVALFRWNNYFSRFFVFLPKKPSQADKNTVFLCLFYCKVKSEALNIIST